MKLSRLLTTVLHILLLALFSTHSLAHPRYDTLRWVVGPSSAGKTTVPTRAEKTHSTPPEIARKGFYGGLALGATVSQVDGDGHSGFRRINALASAWVAYDWNTHWGLRLDFRYLGKGSHAVSKQNGTTQLDYDLQLHYFELPLQLQLHPLGQLTLGAGPAIAYLIAYQEHNTYGNLANSRGTPKQFELSALASLIWRFYRGLGLTGGWQYSLLPIRGLMAKSSMAPQQGQFNHLLFLALDYRF